MGQAGIWKDEVGVSGIDSIRAVVFGHVFSSLHTHTHHKGAVVALRAMGFV